MSNSNNSSILINGNIIAFSQINKDFTIIQQAQLLDIIIPRFCYHEALSVAGNCRMCMVEVKNVLKPVIACATSINNGMQIYTNSDLVKSARENVIEFLLINHPLDCPICDQGGECDLQDQTEIYGSDKGRFQDIKRSVEDKELGPVIKTIMTRCIHCTRCIRFSEELLSYPVLGTLGRGGDTEIGSYLNQYYLSELSGNIIDICPVGALTSKSYAFRSRPWELTSVHSNDIFDCLGSSIKVDLKSNEIFRILPITNMELNEHFITDKARFFFESFLVNMVNKPITFIKNKGNLRTFYYTSWEIILIHLVSKFHFYTNKFGKDSIYFKIGGIQDAYSLSKIYCFCTYLGIENISSFFNSNMDFRYSYLINESINNLFNVNGIFFIHCDLSLQCAVLSIKLNRLLLSKNVSIFTIGSFNYKLKNNNTHISINSRCFESIVFGKHYICNKLLKLSNFRIFTSSMTDNIYFLKYLSSYNMDIFYSFISNNLIEITSFEMGLKYIKQYHKKNKFINLIESTIDYISDDYLDKNFVVMYGTHLLHKKYLDFFLPIKNFLSNNNIYINNQGSLSKLPQIYDKPGWHMYRLEFIFETVLKFMLNINENFNYYLNTYISLIAVNYIFNDQYFNYDSNDVNIILPTSLIYYNNTYNYQWSSDLFYFSIDMLKDSITLSSSNLLHKKAQSNYIL